MKINSSIKLIASVAKENPNAVFAVCLCLILSSLLEAVGIASIFPIIAIVLETNTEMPDSTLANMITYMKSWGVYYLSAVVIVSFILKSILMHLMYNIIASNVSEFSHSLRSEFINAILSGDINYVQSKSLGESLSVLTNDSVRAAAAYISAARVLSGIFQVILYVAYALWLSLTATFISFLTMIVLVILVKNTMKKTRVAGAQTTELVHQISRNMGETIRGIKAAKATSKEKYLSRLINQGSRDLQGAHAVAIAVGQVLRNIQDPVLIASALFCLILFKDVLTLEPDYILFIMAVYYRLMTSLNLVQADYQKFIGQEKSLSTIQNNIEFAKKHAEKIQDNGMKAPENTENITFNNVGLSYDNKKILDNISFKIPKHKLSLLRGESGKGKTTTIDMICTLIRPDSGEIKVGDTPLWEINTQSWRKNLGYVDQFPFLFKASIKENIILDSADIPQEDIHQAIERSHLKKFIEEHENGLEFALNEGGSNISGGQRQRIAIARAIIRKPNYLILDEPTSALDSESEDIIFKTLQELSKTMTVIVVSHSKELEKYADNVVNFNTL